MGIENFFNSFKKSHSIDINQVDNNNKLFYKHLYLDFNSIIHTVANNIEQYINYVIYAKIINKIDTKYTDIIKNYNLDIDNINNSDIITWCSEFNLYIHEHINTQFIIREIEKYIYCLIDTLMNGNVLETLFISVDGIPHMAKIIEQKRRRNMTYIISKLKKKVYEHYGNSLDENRLLYEKYKYIFNRADINSISIFMNTICLYFASDKFSNEIKSRYCNLDNIVVSGNKEQGEGEKKIITDIIFNNRGESVIFSPDADIIILAAILKNILKYKKNLHSNITIIRYDTYNKLYETLNVNEFCADIYTYIQKNVGDIKISEARVINDICFIFTLLGNDYIPKMNSINIKTDIEILLDIYIYTYINMNNVYITYYVDNKFMINYLAFAKYIENLSRKEVILLKDRYMLNKYYNTKKLKKIFGTKMLIPILTQYIIFANFMYSLRKLNNMSYTSRLSYIKHELIHLLNINDTLLAYLIDKFIKIENIKLPVINTLSVWKLIDKVVNVILNHKTIKPQLILFAKKYIVTDNYHQHNILKGFYHPDIKVTKYDEEVYILLRNYNKHLSGDYEIGQVKLLINNDKYIYKKTNIITDSKVYYKRYFDIDISNKNDIPKLNNIINEYIKGLFWVFDFYMNQNNINTDIVSNWFYKYSHTPLLYHVSKYIYCKKNKIEWFHNIYKSIDDHNIHKNNFITPTEYYIFVNPIQKIDKIYINSDLYNKIVNNHNLYIDLDNIVNKLWKGDTSLVDTSYTFLNKGRLINKIEIGYETWKLLVGTIN
jgi:5'-3' exonuclease